jgi:hypothetical protein
MNRRQLVDLQNAISQRLAEMPNEKCTINILTELDEDDEAVQNILRKEMYLFESRHDLLMVKRKIVNSGTVTHDGRLLHTFNIEWYTHMA